jgi:hypothetical protein
VRLDCGVWDRRIYFGWDTENLHKQFDENLESRRNRDLGRRNTVGLSS